MNVVWEKIYIVGWCEFFFGRLDDLCCAGTFEEVT